MSLMKRITKLCNSNPSGISGDDLHKHCQDVKREQVTAAVRNCLTRGQISRVNPKGQTPLYGPKQERKELDCTPVTTGIPLNDRMPVNSVFRLAA